MENFQGLRVGKHWIIVSVAFFFGCTSQIKQEEIRTLNRNQEFERMVIVKEVSPTLSTPTEDKSVTPKKAKSKKKPITTQGTSKVKQDASSKGETKPIPLIPPVVSKKTLPPVHEPSIEDGQGFLARKPIVNPFLPGEKVVMDVSYFGISAGKVTLEIRPMVEVNGRKAYHFSATAVSNSFFSVIYNVNDKAESFFDYEDFLPLTYSLSVNESKQWRSIQTFFDWPQLRALWWEKKIKVGKNREERRFEWTIEPYAQNVLTSFYYLRTFQLEPGKVLTYRLADDGKNLLVNVTVLRREKITTALGEFKAIVVKPQFEVDGVFKKTGDVFFWLTDDERKMFLKIEAKIKIGTLTLKAEQISWGSRLEISSAQLPTSNEVPSPSSIISPNDPPAEFPSSVPTAHELESQGVSPREPATQPSWPK